MDKLGTFHANKTSMCLDPLHNEWRGWYRKTSLSPQAIFFDWPFQGGISFVDRYLCLSFRLLQPCGHLLRKGWPLCFLVCDVFLCLCHFPIWCPGLERKYSVYCFEFWVRCGTWLYRILIFVFLLTFNKRWYWLIVIDQAVFVLSQKVTQKCN